LALRYLFEEYALDVDLRELCRGQVVMSVAPQVFDLIEYLIRKRDRVVRKDELVNVVWSGRIVSDAAITTRLNVARSVLGDSGEEQRLIKTLPRRGFRFVGAVKEAHRRPAAPTPRPGNVVNPGNSLRLSILVLPFANFSGDPGQDYFVDGLTESLTTDLSRISGSFVIGRHTAFTYKGKAVDLKQIGRELNVRYVLEGSVQRAGNRLRVNAQLVDAETGAHLWADRFDKPIDDLFDMQDEIVSRLANALNAQLIEAEARLAERSPQPNSLDLCFQGIAWFNKGPTPDHMAQARGFFERALTLDPGNVEALVGTAQVAVGTDYLTDDRAERMASAETALIKALSLAPQHARAHMYLGAVQIFTNRAGRGIAECEQALALDHNLADAHGWIGLAKFYVGRATETEAHIHEALRLSPRDIYAHRWLMFIALAKLWDSAEAEAVVWLRRGLEANRNNTLAHFILAATLALLGKLNEARAEAKAGLALNPTFTIRGFRFNAPSSDHPAYLAKRERIYQGMRMAGVPEG
jgi:TolB-like protein/Flp pilus assembly protein TadD